MCLLQSIRGIVPPVAYLFLFDQLSVNVEFDPIETDTNVIAVRAGPFLDIFPVPVSLLTHF
jgi:hypothetical protein